MWASPLPVIPAKAGIHDRISGLLDSRLRGNDEFGEPSAVFLDTTGLTPAWRGRRHGEGEDAGEEVTPGNMKNAEPPRGGSALFHLVPLSGGRPGRGDGLAQSPIITFRSAATSLPAMTAIVASAASGPPVPPSSAGTMCTGMP